jgi:radical SAM protein (TIGR01212 family)
MNWEDKRFHSLNYFLRKTFGSGKIAKIILNANLTCPNRDGSKSRGGCVFCLDGSKYFPENEAPDVTEQFYAYKKRIDAKWPNANYIAYFNAFSNTYGDMDYLRRIFYEAIKIPKVVALSVATRPDCLGDEVLELLLELRKKIFLFIELGLQTSSDKTAILINRQFDAKIYQKAVDNLKSIGANVVTHLILGLPFETKTDMLRSAEFAARSGTDGVKLQLLHVLKKTKLCDMYRLKMFETLAPDEYIDVVVSILEILPPRVVIHRLNGDCPKERLVAPQYCQNKRLVLNGVEKALRKKDTFQGKLSCFD